MVGEGPPDEILQVRKRGRGAPPAWIIGMVPTEHSSEALNNGKPLSLGYIS